MLLTLALLASNVAPGADPDFLLKTKDQAPPFAMRDLKGETFWLRGLVGQEAKDPRKAVLISFFATWSDQSKQETAIVEDVHSRWKGKGVEVVYVGLSQGAKELQPYVDERKIPWRVIPDAFGVLGRRYGASRLPHMLIVDKDGAIAWQRSGASADVKDQIDATLSSLTGAPATGSKKVAASAPSPAATKLTLSRAPATDSSSARWQPLATYLGAAAGAEFQISEEETYESFEKAVAAGKYDVINAGPLLCYQVREQYEPLVHIERQGAPTYFGILFAKRDSPAKTIADLKGKRIGLVDETSTSGGLYPQLALLKAGLVPGKDVELVWLGNQVNVAYAVKKGKVDAGGCFEDCRDTAWHDPREKHDSTKVIAYTEAIPPELVMVRKALPQAVKDKLRAALEQVNKAEGVLSQISEGEGAPITAFVKAGPADLDAVGKVLAQVEKKELKIQ